MIKLIVNADDFGYSEALNYGVIDAHVHGILNSTTTMMNMPGAEHALLLAKKHPTLQVGIHLVLTCGKPLRGDVPTLVDEHGNFKKLRDVQGNPNAISLEDLEKEWVAQIEKFLSLGVKPTHFDSHHHTHGIPEFLPVVKKLSKLYNLPVRRISEDNKEEINPFSDAILKDFYGDSATYDYFDTIKDRVSDGQTVEVMTHPAYLDHHILNGSSYNVARVKELDILTKAVLPEGIELV